MLVYVIVWITILLPYLVTKRRLIKNFNHRYAFFIFCCLTILIGCRHVSVGIDTVVYEEYYYRSLSIAQSIKYERGYYLFAHFFLLLGADFQTFNFIVACILTASLVFFYASYSSNIAFSTLIFMTIGLLSMYMSGTRQSLAIAICSIACIWADKHRGIAHLIISCFFVWIATTFHISSVVGYACVIFIFFRMRLSRKTFSVLIFLASAALFYRNILVSVIQHLIPAKYLSINFQENYQINPLLIIISILIPSFCVLFDHGVEADGKYSSKKTWLYCFSCINILLTILARNSMYFSREAFYFLHANSIIIPNAICIQKHRTNKILMYSLIGILCIIYFLISIPGGTLRIDEYKFFWQE